MKFLYTYLIILYFGIGFGSASAYQQLNKGLPVITNYTGEKISGFPQFWEIVKDSNEVIYTSNSAQVLSFNGVYWDKVYVKNQRTYSIVADKNGKVFVGGENEFGYLDNPVDDSLTRKQYYSLKHLIQDTLSFGEIWKTTAIGDKIYFVSGRHIFEYYQNRIRIYETSSWFLNLFEIEGKPVVSIYEDGLYEIMEGKFEALYSESNLKNFSVSVQVSDSIYWLCHTSCFELNNGVFSLLKTEVDEYLRDNGLFDAEVLNDGTILFGFLSGGGVTQISKEGDLIRHFTEENGLVNNKVLDIFEDDKGRAWISTYEGVSVLEFGLPIRYLTEGLIGGVRSLRFFEDQLFAATNYGVFKYDPFEDTFKVVAYDENGCNNLRVFKSTLLVECNAKLLEYGLGKFTRIIGNYEIDLFEFSRIDSTILYGINEKEFTVYQRFEGEFVAISESYLLPGTPNSLVEEYEGKVWMGSTSVGVMELTFDKGADLISGLEVQTIKLPDDTFNMDTRVAVLDNELVFMTSNGLYRNSRDGSFKRESGYLSASEDTSRNYFKFYQTSDGNTLIRSNSEFQLFIRDDVSQTNVFTPSTVSIFKNVQVNEIIGRDNEFFVATNDEIIYFNAATKYPVRSIFHVQVDEVLVRNDSLINGGRNTEQDILKYQDNELRFTYAAASYDAPEKTQYRVKLEGFDENWTRWTNEAQKDYTNIPEGEYRFVVQAKNIYGTLSTSEPFTFSVLPPWYRAWWAYVLYLILVTVVFYSVYKVRVNQLLKVERMRTKIASDLHDEVSATLTGISYFAEAVRRDKNKAKKEHFISLITESAGDAKEKITDIVWSINPDNDDWGMFLSKCRRYASDLLESKGIKYELKIVEKIPGKLPMEIRQHLWMIYKEMLTNAVRHSNASRLDVIMDVDGRYLKLIVQDDGEGFDSQDQSAGNGVSNIKRRAEVINATLEIDSESGFGTRWRLVLPL